MTKYGCFFLHVYFFSDYSWQCCLKMSSLGLGRIGFERFALFENLVDFLYCVEAHIKVMMNPKK